MDDAPLGSDPRIDWLVLCRTPGLGPVGQKRLLDIFKTPAGIFHASRAELQEAGLQHAAIEYLQQPDRHIFSAEIEWSEQDSHHLITWQDPEYPGLLRQIPDPPLVLFVTGQLSVLQSVQLGIVGSRNPDPTGKQIAWSFARELAELGITITSGLALGIDACSHQGVVDVAGVTVAVLGNGPDIIYPTRHRKLATAITQNGAIVSEFLPGTPPDGRNFPRRNRIISGLATGVLVVEAALRSGSLITARHAMEQGREVFAIPGSIHNPLSKGCHALIKQGAKLVETVQDIIEDLGPLALASNPALEQESKQPERPHDLDEDYHRLLQKMAYDPVSIDQLIDMTGLTVDIVSSMLLILEVRGMVSSCPGGLYMRTEQR